MSQEQRELRRAAARAFMSSLDQLQDSLISEKSDPKHRVFSADRSPEAVLQERFGRAVREPLQQEPSLTVEIFEDAVADIEHFMQEHPPLSPDLQELPEFPA
jgi:hypothetical protein